MSEALKKLADRYFSLLACKFPVMCASDEFHFLPRAESAAAYYDRLDDVSEKTINCVLDSVQGFHKAFHAQAQTEKNFDQQIDAALLKSSAAGFLIAFGQAGVWRCNPLLYLKIAMIGLDHALTKPCGGPAQRAHCLRSRLSAAPGLLGRASTQITHVPTVYYQASLSMIRDAKYYLAEVVQTDAAACADAGAWAAMAAALDDFAAHLRSLTPIADHAYRGAPLAVTLKEHFASERLPEEIFEIAVAQWEKDATRVRRLAETIDSGRSWQHIYRSDCCLKSPQKDIFQCYCEEIARLRSFFGRHGFVSDDLAAPLELAETPSYLKSVRSSASFAAAFSRNPSEKSYFYITPRFHGQSDSEAGRLQRRLHREYPFLAAHETIPGHHLLDSMRRSNPNPVRRQIESPLFYEGWATYAERLLTDYGYIHQPLSQLVDFKRRLWRSARCQIDVGLPSGRLNPMQAVSLLAYCGFSPEEAKRQINRFQLNPGYQLCYTLGCHELMQLRQKWGARIGRDRFHRLILQSGQMPFHLLDQALALQASA